MSGSALKALIFDLDDTLVVEKASATAAFVETCRLATERHGIDAEALHETLRQTCRQLWWYHSPARPYAVDVGISSWEALWSRFSGDGDDLRRLRAWAPDYRLHSWHNALRAHGVDDIDFATQLAETFPALRCQRHVVYDDVLPTLEQFKQSYRLALLTNGASDLQREKTAGAGIASYFDEILVAGDIGVAKPHARMFTTMLARLKIEPHDAVMIGDSQSKDVQGAQAVGIKAIWLNRDNTPRRNAITPDLEVKNLREIPKKAVTAGLLAAPSRGDC
jgi:putative hydrolase of the HAD superfamily